MVDESDQVKGEKLTSSSITYYDEFPPDSPLLFRSRHDVLVLVALLGLRREKDGARLSFRFFFEGEAAAVGKKRGVDEKWIWKRLLGQADEMVGGKRKDRMLRGVGREEQLSCSRSRPAPPKLRALSESHRLVALKMEE